MSVGLFLGSLISFIDLCLSLCQYHTFLISYIISLNISKNDSSHFTLLFQNCFSQSSFFAFSYTFQYNLSISTKKICEVWIEIMLNLYISLGIIDTFTTWTLPIHEHNMSLNLFRSSLISLISTVQFPAYEFCTFLLNLHLNISLF